MASQSNNYSGSRETRGEPPYAPRTLDDRRAKLRADAQMVAKATSRHRLGQLLPEGGDNRDITIKSLQAQLA